MRTYSFMLEMYTYLKCATHHGMFCHAVMQYLNKIGVTQGS